MVNIGLLWYIWEAKRVEIWRLSDAPLSKLIDLVFNLSDLTTCTEVYVCAYVYKKNREGRGESVLWTEAFVNTLITSQLPTKIAISAINFSAW